jgi:hypothetical protein
MQQTLFETFDLKERVAVGVGDTRPSRKFHCAAAMLDSNKTMQCEHGINAREIAAGFSSSREDLSHIVVVTKP